ncbi:MAG: nitrile hydratase subunit beta [Betaproteobacteria bacterium]|nr:nitrile hydratase subunit beta [Betaproteobacteria bacterium]
MNGPHDLGGAMGFGAVLPESDEPVFHEAWERRAFAVTLAAGFLGRWNIDMARSARESLPPARYLGSSYYEIWTLGLERLLQSRGLASAAEIGAGRAFDPPLPGVRAVPAQAVAGVLARGGPTLREAAAPARWREGDRVRARNIHPAGHVRLPRYVRGHVGVITAIHGAHVFPDSNALGLGEQPQWLYTVEFSGRELWGPDGTADSVCVDCWESYLESAPSEGAAG